MRSSNKLNFHKSGKIISDSGDNIVSICRKRLTFINELLTFRIEYKQLLAMWMICALLVPMFAAPASAAAANLKNSETSSEEDYSQFEPVNGERSLLNDFSAKADLAIERIFAPSLSASDISATSDNGLTESSENAKKEENTEAGANSSADREITGEKPEILDDKNRRSKLGSLSIENKNDEAVEQKDEVKKPTGEAESQSSPTVDKSAAQTATLVINQLPDNERETIYSYENNLGSPKGQTEMDSTNEAAATRIKHRAGIANFSFDVSLASLSGRGIDAGASVTYNSRTWNKSCVQYDSNGSCTENHFSYDVEQSWLAPGFSAGFGYLESNTQPLYYNGNVYAYKTYPTGLVEADGTRHQLYCRQSSGSACLLYETSDGSFIRLSGQVIGSSSANATFSAAYPNGSKVYFAGASGTGTFRKHYPVILQDRNGNRIRIAYKSDQSGRIDYITDTLNREIKFYYGTDAAGNGDKLVAVTIPGLNAAEELQTVRFYYQNLNLNAQTAFSGQVTAPSTPIQVLRFVYFPATKTGFKYDYHPNYGMIRKISRLVGMTVSDAASVSTTGTVTSEGTWAATTEYDFPDGSVALSDVPKYSKRTDDWQGRTSATAAETFYDVPEPSAGADRFSRISVKDKEYNPSSNTYTDFETISETVSYNTYDWMNGLVKETSLKKNYGPGGQFTNLMAKTKYFWEQGQAAYGNRRNPILRKVEITNDAGLTNTIRYEYDQYNNQTVVEEYNFGQNETNAAPLRRTETTYETGPGWIGANLLGLVKSIQTKVGGAVVSRTLYEYDNNGNDAGMTRRDDMDVSTHDTFYNPAHPEWTERVCPDGNIGDASRTGESLSEENGCVIIHHPGYTSASAYRGNVTKIGRLLDINATTATDTNSDKTDYNYDIAGNLVSATLSCCQLKTLDYGQTFAETGYAYQTKETKGNSPQLISEVSYNKNTGLPVSLKDENGQITTYEYEPDTLRQKKVTYPNGGYALNEYSDKLLSDPAQLVIAFSRQTITLEANKFAVAYKYFDGRGVSIRNANQTPDGWNIQAIEYDALGRVKRSYNPYYGTSPNGPIPAGSKYTEVLNYDSLDRITQSKLQDDAIVQTSFNGVIITATDPAGRQRRQIADALGRLVRVDEPDSSGSIGGVSSPTQPTNYEYDGNGNLKKITQTDGGITQVREFKYDALSRQTHERQVEATPTLNDNGEKGAPSPEKWTKVLKYSSHGLLLEGTDARGVKSSFSYDGLNRIQSVTFSDNTPAITYTYDQARTGYFNKGRLTRVETAAGDTNLRPDTPATATEFDYDNMAKLRSHRQSIGSQNYNLGYSYNLAGQLISETYPSGKVINVGYDANGRLTSIADASRTYLNSLQYQGKGNSLSSMTLGNGTIQSFTLNDRLQMTNQILTKNSDVLQKYDYDYGELDSNGILRNTGKLEQVRSYIGANKQWTQKFSYDSVGRLSEAKELRGDTDALSYKQKFDYDRFGNLYRKSASNPTTGQQTPISFTPIEDSDVSKTNNRFTTGTVYDDAGNVITDTKFRNSNFWYDANGRVYKTTRTDTSNQANSVYDASGMRVATQVNGVWQFYIYNAFGKVIAEYGGIQGVGEGGVKYVLSDRQGSTRAILSNTGAVKARIDYTAFGEEINSGIGQRTQQQGFNVNQSLRNKYAQTERDEATGLDHTWFRKIENAAGRWTSPDPYNGSMNLGNPQSFNRYSYVGNQPTNFVDPSGLQLIAFIYPVCDNSERGGCYWAVHFMYIPDPTEGSGIGGGMSGGNFILNDPCETILEKVMKTLSLVAKRARELQQDALNLVGRGIITNQDLENYISNMNDARDPRRIRNQGSVESHEDSFRQAQNPLRRAVNNFDNNDCGKKGFKLPEGARELAKSDPPGRTRPLDNGDPLFSAETLTAITIAGVVLYWIVSEGSRIVFPPRNLVPVL